MADAAATETKRPKAGRSPAYPGISLKAALAKAQALYDAEGKYPAPMSSAFKAWGYGAKSSGGRETRAALKYFGLISYDGEDGKVTLTDDAMRVLLDKREDKTEKRAIIRRLALMPVIYKKLVDQYPEGIKSDATAAHFLAFDEHYNHNKVEELLRAFKETAEFAELFKPSTSLDKTGDNGDNAGDEPKSPAIGDFVNWLSGDQIQWKTPWKVAAIDTHEDGSKYLKVEGTGSDAGQKGWIPMTEAVPAEAPAPTPKNFMPPPRGSADNATGEGWHEERLIDDGGEEIFIRYKAEPSAERYEFIRDYLDFKIQRLKKSPKKGEGG